MEIDISTGNSFISEDFNIITCQKDTDERFDLKAKNDDYQSYFNGSTTTYGTLRYNYSRNFVRISEKIKQIEVLKKKYPDIKDTFHLVFEKIRKERFLNKNLSCDKITVIKNYKKGDIIKKANQYYKIIGLKYSFRPHNYNLYLVIENMISEEQTNFPFNLPSIPIKTHILSDRIKNRIATEKIAYKNKLKEFKKSLEEKKKSADLEPTNFNFGFFKEYRGKKK